MTKKEEIEFRGISKETGEWVYGVPLKVKGKIFMISIDYEVHDEILGSPTEWWNFHDEIEEETLGQYTTLDIEHENQLINKKIFGGDIVKFKMKNEFLLGVFSYNEEELRWELDIYKKPMYVVLSYNTQKMSDFEAIGNIHQNKELIK